MHRICSVLPPVNDQSLLVLSPDLTRHLVVQLKKGTSSRKQTNCRLCSSFVIRDVNVSSVKPLSIVELSEATDSTQSGSRSARRGAGTSREYNTVQQRFLP